MKVAVQTFETPSDLNQTALREVLRKIKKADFYILECHEKINYIAQGLKVVFKDRYNTEIGIVLHHNGLDHYSWSLTAMNNYGPPFMVATIHSNMPA